MDLPNASRRDDEENESFETFFAQNPNEHENNERQEEENNTTCTLKRGKEHQKQSQSTQPATQNRMHHSAEAGKVDELRELISQDPESVHKVDGKGQTPLHLATKCLHSQCCEILLKVSKREVNAKDKSGYTPLLISISAGDTSSEITKLLLANSANVKLTNNGKRTALHIAADVGNVKTLKLLTEADNSLLDAADREGITPLHLASRSGNVTACIELISAGANKDVSDGEGRSSLHWASKKGFVKCMEVLLSKGCDVNAVDIKGNTALHTFCASRKNKPECARLLLSHKTNPNARNSEGKTPFHLAQYSPFEVTTEFREYQIDLMIVDNSGRTVLHCAADRRHTSQHVEFIFDMEEIANVKYDLINAKDGQGKTALHVAAELGEIETCRFLIKKGADKNVSDNLKNTALHLAAEKGFTKNSEFLIEKGAKLNIKNSMLLTPLHLAAKNGHSECCEMLIRKGSQAADTDAVKNTVLHYAVLGGHASSIKVITNLQPILINKPNDQQKTPLYISVEQGSLECCKALISEKTDLWASFSPGIPSPIRLAYEKKFYDIFEYLLKNCCVVNSTQSKKDIDFRKLMKNALCVSNRQVVKAIVESIYWEDSLQPYYNEDTEHFHNGNIHSRKLSDVLLCRKRPDEMQNLNLSDLAGKYPELAEQVFDRCLPELTNIAESSIRDRAKFCYRTQYLDEICRQTGNIEYDEESRECLLPSSSPVDIIDLENGRLKNNVKTNSVSHKWRHDHVLACAVRHGCHRLLTHPLVTHWVRYKWHKYIRYLYYISLVLIIAHVVLLFIFASIAWDWREMHEKYHLNQTSVCKLDHKIVGPEVVELLKREAQRPNSISYGLFAIIILWISYSIYKIAKIRAMRMDTFLSILCIIADILFLGNFTSCSRITYVREDWQWVAGPSALALACIKVKQALNTHPYYKPMCFNLVLFFIATRDVIVQIIPLWIVWSLFCRLAPKGSQTLSNMNWFVATFHEMPSNGTLVVILLVAIVLLAQIRKGSESKEKGNDWKQANLAINMILDYELLFPFLRRKFYVARISVNLENSTREGCCNQVRQCLSFKITKNAIKERRPMDDSNRIKELFDNIQNKASKVTHLMADFYNDETNYEMLIADIQDDVTKIHSILSKYNQMGHNKLMSYER